MNDWRPYEPSLEAERSAVYERAARRALTVTREELEWARAHPLQLIDRKFEQDRAAHAVALEIEEFFRRGFDR